jgi:hypothetical protein
MYDGKIWSGGIVTGIGRLNGCVFQPHRLDRSSAKLTKKGKNSVEVMVIANDVR